MSTALSLIQKVISVAIVGAALSSMLSQAGELSLAATPMAAVHCEAGAKNLKVEPQSSSVRTGSAVKIR